MKFRKEISATTANTVITHLVDVAVRAAQEWDWVKFVMSDGTDVVCSGYSRSSDESAVPEHFASVIAYAKSSTIEITKEQGRYVLAFNGQRGSLLSHWGMFIVELLKADKGEISDYETSVPGMEPWEDLLSWFRRIVGNPNEPLHPFDPVNGNGEANHFNRRFYMAIKELVRKRKLNGDELKLYRDVIVRDIKREYRWPDAA
ncbi:MAG: hypothetical protein AAB927_03470 [Patescibacteria group bacterium]